MQILVSDPTYADWQGDRDALVRELESLLEDLGPYDLERGDIGPGADWPMFLAIFPAVGVVFLLGETINKNIDAWIAIAHKLNKLLSVLRKKLGATRIDAVGASLLALRHIADKETGVQAVRALSSEVVTIHGFSGRDPDRLDARYNALYVQVYQVNEEWIYVFLIRSDGEIDTVKKYGAHFMTFGPPAP